MERSEKSIQDITMMDSNNGQQLTESFSQMNIDSEQQGMQRRRSTLILREKDEFHPMTPAESQQQQPQQQEQQQELIPIELQWKQGGEKVYVTGSFTGWRKMIGLARAPDGSFAIKLQLPPGTHRFRFIVDNELRFSDHLPTATDQMGNFVNYLELAPKKPVQAEPAPEQQKQTMPRGDSRAAFMQDDDDMGNGYTRYHEDAGHKTEYKYTTDIPAVFTDPSVMEQYYLTLDRNTRGGGNQSWLTPPLLPPHLESVILNNYSNTDNTNNSGALPIPNHVVLNHLATSSIKHNTLAVASVVRYKRKYVTQVLYAPLQ